MPDGTFDPAVLDAIQREVKGFGDDVKTLKDSLQKDLAEVRKLAEEAKGAAGNPEVKEQLDALTASVTEKQAALEKKLSERLDGVETKLARPRAPGAETATAEERKGAEDFHRAGLAARGQLKVGADVAMSDADFGAVKAYADTFGLYLRRGEGHVEAKTMSVGSDPDGGYLVTPAISSRMLTIIYESSPLRELATVESISTDSIEFPVDEDEADAGWVGETEARTTTGTPQVGVQRIPVHEMYANPKATQKLLEDASVNIEAWLSRKVGEKFGRTEATAFVSGTGVKQPRGFLSYPAGTSRGQIEQINSGAATAITGDGLINCAMSLKEFYTAGAVWLMRRATIAHVMLLKDGNGQYIWRPGLEAGKPSVLLGYPVREAADMPAVGAGNLAIAFGNFARGYTIVDRLGVSTLRDPYTAKPFVQFYSRKRVGGDVTTFEAIKLLKVAA